MLITKILATMALFAIVFAVVEGHHWPSPMASGPPSGAIPAVVEGAFDLGGEGATHTIAVVFRNDQDADQRTEYTGYWTVDRHQETALLADLAEGTAVALSLSATDGAVWVEGDSLLGAGDLTVGSN